ncbi:MAG: ABC-F family ATP-binding cassette domain-containing protein [Chitinivibrionales bacterium]|nr:ABC-F family ATP-binding cassette domain-containing protein [Chitinivibrionales bacterium]
MIKNPAESVQTWFPAVSKKSFQCCRSMQEKESVISLQKISKQFGSKIIYQNTSVSFNPMYKTGLIGPNGSGKTMLLRILLSQETVDEGSVSIPSDCKIGYLPQEMNIRRSITPLNLVLEPSSYLNHLDRVTEQLSSVDQDDQRSYKKIVQQWDSLQREHMLHDGYSLAARAKSLLAGLGVPQQTWEQDIGALSGGFQMRVLLAQLLLLNPDFLLLDEPTNHLDMDSLIWLEKFIQKFKGGMIIISHDREFLNRVIDITVALEQGKFIQYTGTVDEYFVWKEEQAQLNQRTTKNIQNKIQQTETFITRFKSKNTKSTQARSKMKQLERLKEELPEQVNIGGCKAVKFSFVQPPRSGSVPLLFENVAVAYGEKSVFSDLSVTVSRGDKIAIIGPNGAGKSTFLKACFNLVPLSAGTLTLGYNTAIRYYSQHRLEQLEANKTLYDTIAQAGHTCDKNYIYSLMGVFLFSEEDGLKPVRVLSGGEKSRLSLAVLLADPGNVLLLDEPTNHLDILSTQRLAQALQEFDGTVILVSHDEYFIATIATRIIEMRPNLFRDFPGTLTDYRSYIEAGYLEDLSAGAQHHEPQNSASVVEPFTDKQERILKRQEKKRLERSIEKIERTIEELETALQSDTEQLHAPGNGSNFTILGEIQQRITQQQAEYEQMLMQWEEQQNELKKIIDDC